ncbi:hypothetical protein GGR54DRAFT_506556 [Hypoxylon sp. NC1633]|nr:hypothetical protein GGR54DRAFT_506556 [Hypoxylon sp. NC1633]
MFNTHSSSNCNRIYPTMSRSKTLALALSVTSVVANPLPVNPASRVVRRDVPAPSAYPIGDACGNEWQYLNFDPNNDADNGHL